MSHWFIKASGHWRVCGRKCHLEPLVAGESQCRPFRFCPKPVMHNYPPLEKQFLAWNYVSGRDWTPHHDPSAHPMNWMLSDPAYPKEGIPISTPSANGDGMYKMSFKQTMRIEASYMERVPNVHGLCLSDFPRCCDTIPDTNLKKKRSILAHISLHRWLALRQNHMAQAQGKGELLMAK